jgi:hypothetical protein
VSISHLSPNLDIAVFLLDCIPLRPLRTPQGGIEMNPLRLRVEV